MLRYLARILGAIFLIGMLATMFGMDASQAFGAIVAWGLLAAAAVAVAALVRLGVRWTRR